MQSRFFNSKLFKDSFWAIVGNGIGNALLLISGILIARLLGANLYGEYGVVKTNMFYMAGFATFGLVYTSTRYIAKYIRKDDTRVIGIIKTATKITFVFSSLMALCLLMSANWLEKILDASGISSVFRALSIIIILKALASTGNGILAGLCEFKHLAYSSIVSGIAMFITCIPFTYFFGLYGALAALSISQLMNLSINYFYIYKACKRLPIYYIREDKAKDLLKFSFPIALQEISYALCNWAGILLLTKFSSLTQVGLYTATAQWNAVIMIIPGMLANVVLSHLSGTEGKQQQKMIYRVLLVYFICTIIPFIIVYMLSDFIISFYGSDFSAMKTVLRLNILITIPACCSEVFKAELIAIGKTWLLFSFRMMKDILLVIFAWFLLTSRHGNNGAFYYSMSVLIGTMTFFIAMIFAYRLVVKKHNCH
ncbi:oligosaccharide flippase family protein [Bacteroides sp. AN502(2024)]|uniref:oligosaccharide flippase family protein n=1 Tax=Bacteroides sp. AN502(2024) TaxID=3160599 RepID=UPI003518DD50